MNKLALGTVQFGLDYGISNTHGKTSYTEVEAILGYARNAGINLLDTAPAYGNSEEVLGRYLKEPDNNFEIVSKLPADFSSVKETVIHSLTQLQTDKFYGYIYHNFNVFKGNPDSIYDLYELQNSGIIRKVGFSLYKTEELDFLLQNEIKFNIVQVPYSIFDRRFSRYFELLKDMDVEVHARSAFLQGLAFVNPSDLNTFFKPVTSQIEELNALSIKSGLSIADICLLWCTQNEFIDKVVIGVNTRDNLIDNIESAKKYFDFKSSTWLKGIEIRDESILLPFLWKKGR